AMKIISVANQKGGCGKTTLAVNVAAALARLGSETLLIDLDPQGHATFAMGYSKEASEKKTSYDIFRGYFDNEKTVYPELVMNDRTRLSFIPANMMLSAAEINLGSVTGAASILYKVLSDQYFRRFDYVIIDSPPSFGFLTLNSMYAADMIVVPMDLSYFSFNGINGVYRVTGLLKSEIGRNPQVYFAMNIFDQRSNFAKQFEGDARKKLGPYLLSNKVRSSVRLREAAKAGKTIFEYDPKSTAALDFYNLTSELITVDMKNADVIVREFALHAPQAGSVYVLGDFNNWQKSESNMLTKLETGQWSGHFTLGKGRHRYKFLVDDEWHNDPHNPAVEANVFGGADSIIEF
ncbi:MAG: AAA family ATPase, partial [Candidatus Omnitrophica bacterium]|nr:AAA family ATPase [Candidatus Omnitrophota bacterium]